MSFFKVNIVIMAWMKVHRDVKCYKLAELGGKIVISCILALVMHFLAKIWYWYYKCVCDPEVMDLMDALPSMSCLKLLSLCCMWCLISCPRLWTFAEISSFDKALSSFLYSELVVFLKYYKQSQEVHFSQICVKLQFGSLNVNVCSY